MNNPQAGSIDWASLTVLPLELIFRYVAPTRTLAFLN